MRTRVVSLLCASLLLLTMANATATWKKADGGDWTDCSNWKGNRCPSIGERLIEVVSMKTGATITNVHGTYGGKLITGRGTLSLSGRLRVYSWETQKDMVILSREEDLRAPHEFVVDTNVEITNQVNLYSSVLVSRREIYVKGALVMKGFGASISGEYIRIGVDAELFVVFDKEKTHKLLIAPIIQFEGGSLLLHRHQDATMALPADIAFATLIIGSFGKVKGGSIVHTNSSITINDLQLPDEEKEAYVLNQMTRGRFNNERIDLESAMGWCHDLNRTCILHDFRHEHVNVTQIFQEDNIRAYLKFKYYDEHYEVDPEAEILLYSGSKNCEGFKSKWGLPGTQWLKIGLDVRMAKRSTERNRNLKIENMREAEEKYIIFCPQYSYKRKGGRIRNNLELLPKFGEMADRIIEEFFGSEEFIAVHMRGEDFDGYHCKIREQRNQAKPNECRQNPAYIRDFVLEVIKVTNISNVYLLSNAADKSKAIVKDVIKVKELDWSKYERIDSILIDMLVACKARYFVGNRFSTFTGGIRELRSERFKKSEEFTFIYGREIKIGS